MRGGGEAQAARQKSVGREKLSKRMANEGTGTCTHCAVQRVEGAVDVDVGRANGLACVGGQ